MDSYEELRQAEREAEQEEVYSPRSRKVEEIISHKTDVGRLVYEIIGRNAPPLFYAHCNTFVSDMLGDGWIWFSIEAKLRGALQWCKEKGANHAGLRTILKRIRTEAK